MKNTKWLIFSAVMVAILIFLYFRIEDTTYLIVYSCMFLCLALPIDIYLFLAPYKLDIDSIAINKIDDKKFIFTYEDINYEFYIDKIFNSHWPLPWISKYDSNGKKVPLVSRIKIRNFLVKNYTDEEMKNEITFLSSSQMMEKFPDMKLCDEEKRKEIVDSALIVPPYGIMLTILIVFLLLIYKPITYHLRTGQYVLVLVVIIPVILLIFAYIIRRNDYIMSKNSKVYYKKMYIYEKEIDNSGDTGIFYLVRFWDKKKYVLYRWYDVSEKVYKKKELGDSVDIYLVDCPDTKFVVFRFEDEKKED